VLETTRELGIAFVAYSPLGRGVLTGRITRPEDLPEEDFRRKNPRFQEEALRHNLRIVEKVREVAEAAGATPGQVALAWLLAQDGVVAIPGTKRRTYLEENVAAADLVLTDDQLRALDEAAPVGAVQGQRYDDANMAQVHL
jgi:aryl-alcohol dehydrogenase-like predicted oxidoreductase